MQPGLSRAVPMAVIGFLFGALLVIVIRGLQQLDPLWAPGPGIILSAPMMALFFVWGMGAFNPKLSVHGEAEEAAHEALAAEAEKPRSLLFGSVWQVAALLIVLLVVLGGFAALPNGLALTQTVSDYASPTMVGFVPFDLPFGGPTIYVSQLVLFAAFIIWAFLSLVAAAGVIGWVIFFLSRGVAEVQVSAKGGAAAALPAPTTPAPSPEEARQNALSVVQGIGALVVIFIVLYVLISLLFPTLQIPLVSLLLSTHDQIVVISVIGSLIITQLALGRERVMLALPFLGWFIALYWVFYFVAIGLIMPKPALPGLSLIVSDPGVQLMIISAVNAIIFTLVILRTQLVLAVIGRVAGWLAHVLRSIPRFLQ